MENQPVKDEIQTSGSDSEYIREITSETKIIAIISYITFAGLIVSYVMNSETKDSFAAYHIRQSLGLNLTGLVLSIIAGIPWLGLISYLCILPLFALWLMGLMNVINNKQKPVPWLGEKYEEWFKKK